MTNINANTPDYWNRVWKASGEGRRTVEAYIFGGSVVSPKSTVLDLGCGICAGNRLLREYGFNITGMDFASEAEKAHNRKFLQHDVQKPFPCDDKSFDVVLAMMVIQCLNDPSAMIAEAYRVLRPRGMFLVASPGKHRLLIILRSMSRCIWSISPDMVVRRHQRESTVSGESLSPTICGMGTGLLSLCIWLTCDISP